MEIEKVDTPFEVITDMKPSGDQPEAIKEIAERVNNQEKDIVLLGATGTGKTATMAWAIEKLQRPTLIIEPNKTLAAQLAAEFRELMPNNRVEYFVSYYDYYRPESYIPSTDLYIEKDSSINDEIERLRHSATASLLTHNDVVVVASVSCIYGLGSPAEYSKMMIEIKKDQEINMEDLIQNLVSIQYQRSDYDFIRGTFRVKGDTLDVFPVYETKPIRLEFFGDTIDRISMLEPTTFKEEKNIEKIYIFPATHYASDDSHIDNAIKTIKEELKERLLWFERRDKLVEKQRLEQRTKYDLELLREIGTCKGIENYSRHLDGRQAGTPPNTLMDFFPKDWLLVIDESHITIPQIGAMFEGDMSRKNSLVDYGFRLPSCKDNRPLNFEEFQQRMPQTIYLSATPGPYELERSDGVVEQIIRPTGLIDPEIEVKSTKGQIDDLMEEIQKRIEKKQRVLVTTLTKKMAEDLSLYLEENGVKVNYLHSDIDTLQRVEILRNLRAGVFDVLVGINLLREGLDLPEVSLVAIFDADKQGFLRSYRSLIQTIGRAARNVEGKVIMYADSITEQMDQAIKETNRRRIRQQEYNKINHIDPKPLNKKISDVLDMIDSTEIDNSKNFSRFSKGKAPSQRAENNATARIVDFKQSLGVGNLEGRNLGTDQGTGKISNSSQNKNSVLNLKPPSKTQLQSDLEFEIKYLTEQMRTYASNLQFELAAQLRDQINALKKEYRDLN